MPLCALVVCSDPKLLQTVVPLLDGCRIESDVCTRADHAVGRLGCKRYEAVIVDCASLDSGATLQRMIANSRSTLFFGLASGSLDAREAGRCGANFILEKPLTPESLLKALRAAYGLMVSERRRYFRHSVSFPITITTEKFPELIAMAVNVSQGGMAVRSAIPVAQKGKVLLRFELPSSDRTLSAESEIRWTRNDVLGFEFLRMARRDREELVTWLGEQYEASDDVPSLPASVSLTL